MDTALSHQGTGPPAFLLMEDGCQALVPGAGWYEYRFTKFKKRFIHYSWRPAPGT